MHPGPPRCLSRALERRRMTGASTEPLESRVSLPNHGTFDDDSGYGSPAIEVCRAGKCTVKLLSVCHALRPTWWPATTRLAPDEMWATVLRSLQDRSKPGRQLATSLPSCCSPSGTESYLLFLRRSPSYHTPNLLLINQTICIFLSLTSLILTSTSLESALCTDVR